MVAGADKLLSSALKRYDSAVFETISDTVHSAFFSGTVRYGLDVEGVSLAPFHDAEPAVPKSVKDALVTAEASIIDGSIDLVEDCREYIFVPAIIKPD
jgi:basic membrane lipoprotein Med (substrate-binding protein (PBP1-ABC) superfamily)